MQRRQLLCATLGLGSGLASAAAAPPALHWQQRTLLGLGTTLSLRAAHTQRAQANQALDAAVAAIRRVEASMSLYRPDSELARLNRDGHLSNPSADLLTVLRTAQQVSRRSQGRFDVTVQPLWALHAQAQRERRAPTGAEITTARQCVGWQHVEVSAQRIRLRRPGMALTCNGIAQGYATDAAREALRQHGVKHALINAGEHAALGRNDRDQPWTLGLEDPHAEHRLLAALQSDGRAIATSADHRSTFSADRRHHHILDPATGDSPPALSSVTVLAPSAMLADALTKVLFIAGPQRIPALARTWNVGVLWVEKSGRWQATTDLKLA